MTAHDGFTLLDLVSYNDKHNEANGEENRDGTSDNLSWNCGVEGPTDDPAVTALRERMVRNFLATLFLSQGVPMLLAGDEIGRTQQGNNNAYCQDNELSWVNWTLSRSAKAQLEFTRRLIRLRLGHPVFHRRRFFQGRRIEGSEVKDLSWFRPDGKEMTEEEWTNGFTRCLGLRLAGDAIEEVDQAGEPIRDDTFLLLLNAHHEALDFVLPAHRTRVRWELVLDTRDWAPAPRAFEPATSIPLEARSLALLRLRSPAEARRDGQSPHRHLPPPARGGLTFGGARDLVPYLAELGITDCYLSPILQPCAPDSHGYDVADHGRLNEALGGRGGLRGARRRLSGRTGWASWSTWSRTTWASRGAERLVAGRARERAASRFASFFDIDWEPLKPELRNRVLLPILEDHYGRVLEKPGAAAPVRGRRVPGPLPRRRPPDRAPHVSPDPDLPAARAGGRARAGRPARAGAPGIAAAAAGLPDADGDRDRSARRSARATRSSSSAGWTRSCASRRR